ncbi:hypothetical protein GA0070607_6505 [Micromonospora coriariae]|uniref:Uncharacterized protein n=1 Tax=Micromonospora coriariae TaxID=285665 RepID=A0A1C4YAZ5_9ACTN|nr:hypothetical protein [Micromonospora coriariae]SCF17816.1 hypothetical protein GA0070607_6505 [Micromonospora coriariae]
MSGLLRQELRGLTRSRALWLLPPLVALAGLGSLSFNADAYMFYVYYDPQTLEEQLDAYHFDVKAIYTSGLGWAQLAALAAGAFLVLRDPWLTGRPALESSPAPLPPPPRPGPYLVVKAGVAALFGVLLAVADLAAVLPLAPRVVADHWVRRELAPKDIFLPVQILAEESVWPVVLRAAAGVPLFAIVGIGLAALLNRWWAVTVAVVVAICGSLYMTADPFFGALTAPSRPALAATMLPSLEAAAIVFLLGYGAARWRLARAPAVRLTGAQA